MKKIGYVLLLIGMSVVSCSSGAKVAKVRHDNGKGIDQIDKLIVQMKSSYLAECVDPLLKDPIPENDCQHQLFGVLERRYRFKFEKKFVNMAANDVFFRDVFGKELTVMMRRDPDVRYQVRKKFTSQEELLDYYKTKYAFN
jgi:hypothetical protein